MSEPLERHEANRLWADVFGGAIVIASWFGLALILISLPEWFTVPYGILYAVSTTNLDVRKGPTKWNLFASAIIIFIPLIASAFFFFGQFVRYVAVLFPLSPSEPERLAGFAAVVLVGTVLYMFRLRDRFSYGITEIFFALYVAWQRSGELGEAFRKGTADATSAATIGIMTGSIYLLVRGISNAHEGWAKESIGKASFKRLKIWLATLRQLIANIK